MQGFKIRKQRSKPHKEAHKKNQRLWSLKKLIHFHTSVKKLQVTVFSATCSSRCKKKTNKQKNHPTNHYQNTTTPNYCYFPEILIDLLFFKEIHYSSEVCHAVFSFHVHEHTVRGWLDWYVQKSIHSRMIENLCHFLTVIQKERKKNKTKQKAFKYSETSI